MNKEYKGESRGRHASQNSYEGYNSITSQLQQIDRVKAEKRQQRDAVAKARRSEQKRQQETPREFKEAKRILDDLPYGSLGDRAKRESMIEHANVLQNMGWAKMGQPPVPTESVQII